MSRALVAGFVVAALIACRDDHQPTSPISSPNASNDVSASPARGEVAFDLGGGNPQQSNDVEAVIVIQRNRGHFRTCNGVDGFYVENHQINTGIVTGDPRLTGDVEMRVTEIVHIGADDFWTPSFGSFVVRDPASGRIKAEGDYNAWAHLDAFEGTIVGRVQDAGGLRGGNLIANVAVFQPADGSFFIRIGGVSPPETRMNTGIFAGKCSGSWTEYDGQVPAPTTLSAARILLGLASRSRFQAQRTVQPANQR
jgi:hypothetical protein